MKIYTLPSSEVLEAAAQALNDTFENLRGKEFLFLSSGGSALGILEYLDVRHFGPQSTIGVLDERYSMDPGLNNMAQVEATDFYKKASALGTHFIDTKIQQDESIEAASGRFEKALREWVARTNGIIIASVGIGPDAHTAGIMPYPKDSQFFNATFNNDAHWVAGYDAQEKSPQKLRITTTFPFQRKIDTAIIYAIGENKRLALLKLLSEEGSSHESPCRIWREVSSAELYTDLSL